MTCGERIKEIRKSLNLTLEKFGEPLGVTKTAISNIEKGNRNLTGQMIKTVCLQYNVNEDWLRNGTGKMFNQTFVLTEGARIREIRKSLGLTLEKFGEPLGVKKSAISGIETGNRNLTDQMIKAVCLQYNVNEDWLRNGTGEMFNQPSDEVAYYVEDLLEYSGTGNPLYDIIIEMMKTYQQLDEPSKEVIRSYFEAIKNNIAEKKTED